MAKLTKKEKYIADMYVRYFGRAADKDKIDAYAKEAKKTSVILKNIKDDADAEKGQIDTADIVNNAYQNLFGRDAFAGEMIKYSKIFDNKGELPINSIYKSAGKAYKDVYKNKIEVAAKYAELGGKDDLDLSKISKGNLITDIKTVTTLADLQAKVAALPENSNVPSAFDGETYTLTTDVNTFKGTAKDDTFLSSSTNHWSVGDSIDGGKGVDTLKIIDNGAIVQTNVIPTGSTIKNVENLDVISGNNVNVNSTSIDGLTLLNITSKTTTGGADNSATASATTDIRVTDTNADTTDDANTITVDGGKDVTVVSKNNGGAADTTSQDAITVGGTTAAAGKVSVTSTGDAAGGAFLGAITVNGGTEITVNQYAGTAVNIAANTGGKVIVNGNASTTTVTVNQTATAAAAATVVGYNAGAVDIHDVNRSSTTDAGIIETVTVKNAGAVDVDSGALKTLKLEGTITSVDATSTGSKATVDTLALNLKGVTVAAGGNVTVDTDVKTLNVNSSTTASTLANLTSAGATTVNVSGDAALTLTNNTFAAATAINVTNTAGVTFDTTAIAVGTTFTGGAGNDTIILAGAQTKAITMGAGNDKVTYAGALGTGGSVAAGEGKDTIVMTLAQAASADNDSTFNTTFTGFETLELNTITSGQTINLTGINAVSTVNLASAVASATVLDNLVSGGKVRVTTDASALLTINVKDALLTNTDVLNLELSNTGILAAGSITAANVETININVADAATLGSAAVVHTANLTLADAKTITVAGNNGLNFTTSTVTKVTNFDASGVVANNTATTTDTAANLAVTFTSGNATAAANVSIKGGAGNDTLTGNAAIDTITGGAGNDTLAGAGGADIINVGEGRDIVVIGATDSTTAVFDSINGFTLATKATVAFTNQAGFLSGTTGGSNVSILDITAGAAVSIKGNITAAAGQAAGVTYTIKDGILTVGGAGASTVDTLGEWFTEAHAALGGVAGASIAFEFGSDTYVYTENGATDVLVKLVGVTGANALVDGYSAATTVDNTILIG